MSIKVRNAARWLADNNGLALPYGFTPGNKAHGQVDIDTEQEWDDYQWNPPQYQFFDGADPNASEKPTWQEIQDAYTASTLSAERNSALNLADEEATKHIALLYHEDADRNPAKEWHVRLSGRDTTEADLHRAILIAVYNGLKTRIEDATTVEQLDAIESDILSDDTWEISE